MSCTLCSWPLEFRCSMPPGRYNFCDRACWEAWHIDNQRTCHKMNERRSS